MPGISANTLFHFTNKLENLLGILTNEFQPRFCLENYDCIASNPDPEGKANKWAVPMVCFCDLPLSQTASHLEIYGDYGIGITKLWGQNNGISPVLYVYRESSLAKIFESLSPSDVGTPAKNRLALFIKPYEGNLWRKEVEHSSIRFYDEREWRFVPDLPPSLLFWDGMSVDDFSNDETRNAANKNLAEVSRIRFEPNDIRYLIVRREEEIVPLVREVERIKGKYSHDDVRLVMSRVISAEQIRADF